MANLRAALSILWLIFIAGSAAADVQSKTTYKYFTVTGNTAREIYQSLLRHGPALGDPDALASTKVNLTQHPTLAEGQTCKMQNFTARMTYQINLPRLSSSSAPSPAIRQNWMSFAGALKTHEERHRLIWTACAERLSWQALHLKPGNCKSFKEAYFKISKSFTTTCTTANSAFDTIERIRFLGSPFIRSVSAGK